MQIKWCDNCKKNKSHDDFHKDNSKKDGLYYICKDCRPLKEHEFLTHKEYKNLFDKQGERCAICLTDDPSEADYRNNRFTIDHCHETHKVRGILCSKCNAFIGHFNDNIKIIENAIAYLQGSLNHLSSFIYIEPIIKFSWNTKECTCCFKDRDINLFYQIPSRKSKNNPLGLSTNCKDCETIKQLTYKSNSKANYYTYDEFCKLQKGRCGICTTLIPNKDPNKKRFCIDHDHNDGRVRGLLCGDCNYALGNARDNINNLKRAIQYLLNSE
jgi:Recombination endonuclease VII